MRNERAMTYLSVATHMMLRGESPRTANAASEAARMQRHGPPLGQRGSLQWVYEVMKFAKDGTLCNLWSESEARE